MARRLEKRMLRSRLLTFAALVAGHAAASFATLWCFAFQTGPPELFCGVMFIPSVLLCKLGENPDHPPDLGALVGVPEDSFLSPVLFLSVNSLLWVTSAYGLWLAGRFAWRKVVRVTNLPTEHA
jgi:hypothetical protein